MIWRKGKRGEVGGKEKRMVLIYGANGGRGIDGGRNEEERRTRGNDG